MNENKVSEFIAWIMMILFLITLGLSIKIILQQRERIEILQTRIEKDLR